MTRCWSPRSRARRAFGSLLLCALFSSLPAVAAIPATQPQALIDLYNSTNGANWINKTNWLGAAGTECTWYGVTCFNGTDVLKLELSGNRLSGTLPSTISGLGAYIGLLDLGNNSIGGTIPSGISSLTNMQHLQLYQNLFTGSIPTALTTLPLLATLDVSENKLTGGIPAALGNLSNLQWLYLDDNPLGGTIPAELGNLKKLQVLWIRNNQVTGSIPGALGSASALKGLYLDSNQLTGAIPSQLGNLTSLTTLYLKNNQLSGSVPATLGNLANLQWLMLDNNALSGTLPTELGNLHLLKYLYLNNNQLSGQMPQLGGLDSLDTIEVTNNKFSGTLPGQLFLNPTITWMRFNNNAFEGPIPSTITGLPNLQLLYLNGNKLIGQLPPGMAALTKLSTLRLEYNGLTAAPAEDAWAEARQPGWKNTQTIAPSNVQVVSTNGWQATVSWTPIAYTADSGHYELWYNSGFGYKKIASTASKTSNQATGTVANYTVSATFIVRTVTDPHSPANSNTVTSTDSQGAESNFTCPPPTITTQPKSQTISSGDSVTLSVTVPPGGNYEYTWFQGLSGDTSMPVQGPFITDNTVNTYTTGPLTKTTSFWCRIGQCVVPAYVASATATITVQGPCQAPAVTAQPTAPTVEAGDVVTLSVTATGTNLRYQWYRGAQPMTANPVGTNSPQFTTSSVDGTTSYWVRVTGDCGTADSATVQVKVKPCPSGTPCAVTSFARLLPGGSIRVTNPQGTTVTGLVRVLSNTPPHGPSSSFTIPPYSTATLTPPTSAPSIADVESDNGVILAGALPMAVAGHPVDLPFSWTPGRSGGTLLVTYVGGAARISLFQTPQSVSPLKVTTLPNPAQLTLAAVPLGSLVPQGMTINDGLLRVEPVAGQASAMTDLEPARLRASRRGLPDGPAIVQETGVARALSSGNRVSTPSTPGTTYRWTLYNAFAEGSTTGNVLTFAAGTEGWATLALDATTGGVTSHAEINVRVAAP